MVGGWSFFCGLGQKVAIGSEYRELEKIFDLVVEKKVFAKDFIMLYTVYVGL